MITVAPKEGVLLADTPHGRFRYYGSDIIGCAIADKQFWDGHLRYALDRLQPGQVMVDVGANIGFFPIYLALHRGVRSHAFEPSPEIYELLVDNIRLNTCEDWITPHPEALYSRETEMQINTTCDWNYPQLADGKVDITLNGNSGQFALMPGRGGVYDIKARMLDSFELSRVDLLKVDAQGCDLRVLVGAVDTIKRCRPVICIEFERVPCAVHEDTKETYLKFFQDIDYRIENEFHPAPDRADDYADYVVVPN